MKGRTFLWKVSVSLGALAVALAMGGPVANAASTIIVDDGASADDCGKYDGKTANPDPVAAINNAPSGSTVLICPGTYDLLWKGVISISNKSKLTIKRALTGPGSRPILKIDGRFLRGIEATNSSVTIDGLILDGTGNDLGYIGISLIGSSATIKNTGLIGPDQDGTYGILSDAIGQTKVQALTVTNSYVVAYSYTGVEVRGPVKLKLSSSYLDATDGGRITAAYAAVGVHFNGMNEAAVGPTGIVTGCRIVNNATGIGVQDASKVSIANNTLVNNTNSAVWIGTTGLYHNADNNKVTGNIILGILENRYGIYIYASDPDSYTVKKTTISKNMISAARYMADGITPIGIYFNIAVPAATTVTATISGNTFWGFPVMPDPRDIVNVNGNAGLTVKGNDALP